jgi:hypothetical protein
MVLRGESDVMVVSLTGRVFMPKKRAAEHPGSRSLSFNAESQPWQCREASDPYRATRPSTDSRELPSVMGVGTHFRGGKVP